MNIDLLNPLLNYPKLLLTVKLSALLLTCIIAYYIANRYLIKWVTALVTKSKTSLDDKIFSQRLMKRLSLVPPILILYNFSYLFGSLLPLIERILTAVSIWIGILISGTLLTTATEVYDALESSKQLPIKSYTQITKIIIYVVGGLVIVAVLLGKSPTVLLSGIGAMTAVLMLIFRDTILSFVASLQITSNDLVNVGDWIEVPKFGADGDVIDIALHTVKVQNWDKTITVIPTHKLIDESFKNWRGMTDSGGRRIKRAIDIDVSSIKFCDDDLLNRLNSIKILEEYLNTKKQELKVYNTSLQAELEHPLNTRHLTNIGCFQAYIRAYLHENSQIHNDLTFLVRQLAPSATGLPIEIYVFSSDTDWIEYERIQADIFDHLFAALPNFELKVFQYPSGGDFSS